MRLHVLIAVVSGCVVTGSLGLSAVAGAAPPGTVVVAAVAGSGHLTNTYGWTIQKTASPASQMVPVGGSASVQYVITTTKTAHGTAGAFFAGSVCVANAGPVATQSLAISVALNQPPASAVLGAAAVDVSAQPVLVAHAWHCYPYKLAVPPAAIVAGATYRQTAHVTITNLLFNPGVPAGPSPSATAVLPRVAAPIDGSITVTDTNGQTFSFTSSGTTAYTQAFPCAAAGGPQTLVHNNTATIGSTGQSASAQATIHCGAPTTLTTALSQSAITPGASASDLATINGAAANAGGTITYTVYSDSSCQTLYADATPTANTVTNAIAPASQSITFSAIGTYYWQAVYSGDPNTNTLSSSSACTAEPLTVAGWQNGDLTTYNQNGWVYIPAGASTLATNFYSVYSTGAVSVGGQFKMLFTTPTAVSAYLPATGSPAPLTGNLVDETSSPAGSFGGDVVALELDVDFADAGALAASSGVTFGDLSVCNLTTLPFGRDDLSILNGMTIRQILAEANTVLGGGTTTLMLSDPVDDLDYLARNLSGAFSNATPSSFAQSNLVDGACT